MLQNARDCACHRTVELVVPPARVGEPAEATRSASRSLRSTPSVAVAQATAAAVAVGAPVGTAGDSRNIRRRKCWAYPPRHVADAVAVSDTGATAAAAATLKVRLPGGVPAATLPALPARSNRSWTVLMPMLGRSACRGADRAASSRTFGRPTLWSSSHPPLSVVTAAVVVGLVPTLGATRGLLLMSAVTIAAATVTGPAVRTARRRTLSRPEAYRPPAGASAAYDSTTLGGWLLL